MLKRSVFLLLLAALALPGTAAAKKLEVSGPLVVVGKGPVHGELSMTSTDESRPVTFFGRGGGKVRFIDLAGDLQVRCHGVGEAGTQNDDEGHKVFVCAGRGGVAKVRGSNFRLAGVAQRYRILLPEGTSGTLQGRFRACTPGEDECVPLGDDDQAADERKQRGERAKDRTERMKERIERVKERAKERGQHRGDRGHQPPGKGGDQGDDEGASSVDDDLDAVIDEITNG